MTQVRLAGHLHRARPTRNGELLARCTIDFFGGNGTQEFERLADAFLDLLERGFIRPAGTNDGALEADYEEELVI